MSGEEESAAVPAGVQENNENVPQEPTEYSCKVVLIGDNGVGKTSLALYFKNNEPPNGELPIITPNFQKDVNLQDKNAVVHIVIWDSACGDDDKEIRVKSYHDTDVFVMCMSLHNSDSMTNLIKVWAKELYTYDKKPNIVICGTHLDSMNIDPIQIQTITQNIPHNFYIETSARSGVGIENSSKLSQKLKLIQNHIQFTLQKTIQ